MENFYLKFKCHFETVLKTNTNFKLSFNNLFKEKERKVNNKKLHRSFTKCPICSNMYDNVSCAKTQIRDIIFFSRVQISTLIKLFGPHYVYQLQTGLLYWNQLGLQFGHLSKFFKLAFLNSEFRIFEYFLDLFQVLRNEKVQVVVSLFHNLRDLKDLMGKTL